MAHVERRMRNGQVTWRARYRAPDGHERSKTFDRRTDAERFLTTVENTKLLGEWVPPERGRIRFVDYANEWFATKANVAPRTLINIEGRLNNHALPFFGEMPVATIRPTHVRAWMSGLIADGLAPGTVKAAYLTFSQIMAQAVIDGLIARTPCRGIEAPSERERDEMHFLTPDQVNALVESIHDRYRALIYTAAYGGLRAGELAALKVSRLNLLAGTLEVAESTAEVRGRLVIGPTKTGKRRTIALPRFLAEILSEHIARYPSAEGFAFTAPEGGPIRHHNFSRRHFRPAVERAGLPENLRFHDLRHTCAAFLIADGRHMEEVKDHLGHSSIRVTSDTYGHLFPQARRAIAEGLDAVFRKASVEPPAAPPRPQTKIVALTNKRETRKRASELDKR